MTDASQLVGNWNYPTQVRFGVGRIKELPEACKSLGMKKPLIVTDMGLKSLPMIADAVKANEAAGVRTGLFGEVKGNPVGRNLEDGIAAYKQGGHDGVIAFGGGSALDTGKAVAFMATQDRPWLDYTDYDTCVKAFKGPIAPIITVATTSGTGSEVGRAAVFTDEVKQVKKIIFHPSMMPKIVIDDPALTVGLPPKITAATGMDAFAHCLEALCCTFYHPMADGIAAEGMRLVKENLPTAVKDGRNLEARANMMCAATMGATAFQKGLGSIHALSHPLSSLYDTHHGLGNAVFMPYVLVFNRKAIEDKLVRLAAYFGLKQQSFTGFIDWLVQFREEIGIPHKLGDAGVPLDNLDRLATLAAEDFCATENPIKMAKPEMRQVIDAAVAGRL